MAMDRMYAMNMSADACTAPAHQSASMTMSAACAVILDTALWAVSFLLEAVAGLIALVVRIMLPWQAKP